MKFNFKIQDYQTDAVNAVIDVFKGQGYHNSTNYIRDLGNIENKYGLQTHFDGLNIDLGMFDLYDDTGYKNADILLSDEDLLSNIRKIQSSNNIKLSDSLIKDIGKCSLDVEMETGTGKTYVYIKTMFELNKKYGWSKFIVVVPSIAIREGVNKTFEITKEHFMEHYGKKARFFTYNSKNLNDLDYFSNNSGISVMIINTQAFATSLKEGGRSNDSRIIYSKRDEFNSRRPIDVISANRPILILDEPQKMGGAVTQKALHNFNPLFSINYSATHKNEHNMVYVLDALDAFNKKLVKKIEVKGFEVKNLRGTDSYLYLEPPIIVSKDKPPMARIEFEIKTNSGVKRKTRKFAVGDDLFDISKGMQQYKGYVISQIDPFTDTVTFTNGEVIKTGDINGDISEEDMRRIQIRETIASHFEKEEMLFNKGIKTLSLFFIDEVSKYRQYDENGEEVLGEYGKVFEEEYINILNEKITLVDTPYQRYLKEMCTDVSNVHKGYFSIDKKGHIIDSKIKRGTDSSDDISAYDLILKNKERLLSFDEPTRFIFSHSALREGWDNPNVFQICTLKHSDSQTAKRQEVGRGLRLCVNQEGNRMDVQTLGENIFDINMLTVIASESYKNFVADLQSDLKKELYNRPTIASVEYFTGKIIKVNGKDVEITQKEAKWINKYLYKNDYIDDDDKVTDEYRKAVKLNELEPMREELKPMAEGIHQLIQAIFDEKVLKEMHQNANKSKVDNSLNDNFKKKEFQELWENINHKYVYKVDFESDELINKVVKELNSDFYVSSIQYITTRGSQKRNITYDEIERGDSFKVENTSTKTMTFSSKSNVKYDLVGKIALETALTRRTVVKILKGMHEDKFYQYRNNPEEFISKVIKIIKEQKATMVVEHITYNQIEDKYDSSIFTAEKNTQPVDKAYKAKKAIKDYIFTDGYAEESTEKKFAKDLDNAEEVCVYAKLPRGFQIPTPVGNYSPDWAIAFNKGSVKHVFFIAETKGSMDSLNLRAVEQAKINCAKKLFNEMSTSKVKYSKVSSYLELMNIMESM